MIYEVISVGRTIKQFYFCLQGTMSRISITWLLLILALCCVHAKKCNREPPREVTAALKTPGDNGYKIILGGETDSYTPGTVYTGNI